MGTKGRSFDCDHEREPIRRARELRREMTVPERMVWQALRDRRLAGWKFRRQAAIGPYIVDFYCHAARLVLEIDGLSHVGRGDQDREREEWLRSRGLHVVRLDNDEVLRELEPVMEGLAVLPGVPADSRGGQISGEIRPRYEALARYAGRGCP